MSAYAAVVDLKSSIERLLSYFDVCLDPASLQIAKNLHKELKSFQKSMKRFDDRSRKRVSASLQQIATAIRRFDDALTSLFEEQVLAQSEENMNPDEIKPYLFSIDLQDLKQESHTLIQTLKETVERFSSAKGGVVSSRFDYRESRSKMVGLCDEYDQLKEDIIGESNRFRKSFSIVGMIGIGKTTLAREIFEDLDILEHFDCRAWVTIGRSCQSCHIPRAVLSQVDPETNGKDEDEEIHKFLKAKLDGKRYLIVLDDVYDAQIYDGVNQLLPNNEGNGSKVLFTTTVRKVAQQVAELVGSVSAYSFDMRLLDKEEGWDLLREKLFGEEYCPPHLVKAGKKIAEHCDGLPLMIVTVANLLSGVEHTPERWGEIGAGRNHPLFIDAYNELSKVLYPSYNYLPQHLKECFLYMGVFPHNYEIPKSKLINMWIVEEIIEQSMEDYALECLEELASYSLVMVYKKSKSKTSSKRPSLKTCGLHSTWLHLCCKEAKINKFFHVMHSYEDGFGEGIKGQTRLSIHNKVLFGIKDVHRSIEEHCSSTAKSLLCLHPYHQYQVPLCFKLRLLQHLDALNIRFYDFPLEVLELVRLKYLAFTCNCDLPTSISNLSSLHFLIVSQHFNFKTSGTPSYLPMSIWDMKELKHLQIMGSDLPDLHGAILPNLSTLLGVSALSCTKTVFQSLPNLNKLGIQIELAPDVIEPLSCFDHICQLKELESLKCVVVNPDYCCGVVAPLSAFPLSLKRLSLSGLGYPWEEMGKIASLPSLEVLKLRCNAFQGSKWEVEGHSFMKLKYLLIEDCDVERLMVGKLKSFRRLQCLSIHHCYNLDELYWKFYEDLSKIEVIDCHPLFEKQMKEALLWKKNVTQDYSWKMNFL
ncbi:hypothetical protein AAHA92_07238 [Salvia divinorum]|uniref:Uncharacterized protein n=1 Tax=Salvia divinorum TaxID=28513 RepID=A0ABD1I8B0_SALDI